MLLYYYVVFVKDTDVFSLRTMYAVITERDADMNGSGYLVVSRDVLPDIFLKVIEVKKAIACGEEKSSSAACRRIGISRSAYYKYKDSVFAYDEKLTRRVISLFAVLKDEPGVLSGLLSEIHKSGANVLTLNQSVPVDGAASVTVTVRLNENAPDPSEYENILMNTEGIVEVRLISGE